MRIAILALLAFLASPAIAQPPPLVAPTDAQSPADEKKGFTVPAGFEVQLVASEPDIQKPMQMAWDAKGRLWVTTSFHYPFAAPQGKGTDKLFVLSDFDPATGKARKVQAFASDLNIPIGILPLPDCKSCIVSSTGEIRKYTDTNDDGKADRMEVLFTGFGYVDTHGMYNSFTLMPDGWVYACHGFRNDSTVKGRDGHEVKMNSGHTFRFRPDGSRIEVYTRGQVNPFGIAVDPWFNLYTADCHSKPITQLIPGAVYDSFGKPHDGLGFGPHVTRHDHGSTGLCGLAWYDADQFPKDYLGCMFVGNVVTSRINFDRIEWRGASPVAKELPDFMTSKDLWFRPVDIKLGPDGALYVCDFYNKIIGHYEVDLKHPGRDKDHGRLWRIVWKGKDGTPPAPKFHRDDFTKATDAELLNDLFHPNLTVRFLAGHQLRHRLTERTDLKGDDKFGTKLLADRDRMASVGGWMMYLLEIREPRTELYEEAVKIAKKEGLKAEQLTGHVVRAMNSRATWGDAERKILLDILRSFDSIHQKRACVEAITFHPHADFVGPLVELLKKTPADDTHLRLAARIALRNCLRDDPKAWPQIYDTIYADMALAIPSKTAAQYLVAQLSAERIARDKVPAVVEHAVRYGEAAKGEELLYDLTQVKPDAPQVDAILAAFRGSTTAGTGVSQRNLLRSLAVVQTELSRLREEQDPPAPDQIVRANDAIRLLLALPSVARDTKVELNRDTVVVLARLVNRPKTPTGLRVAATDALLRFTPDEGLRAVRAILTTTTTPADLRERVLVVCAVSPNKDARLDARDAIKDVPYRTAVAVGTALAGSPAGAVDLLEAVKTGKAPARLLQEKAILERLRAAKIANLDQQIAALTKGLPPLDQKIAQIMKQRAAAFASAKPDKELGARLFTKHCGACHKIGEMGGKIAPQLDGIGNRGLERLLEDTLDPNRNVDQAFRARIIVTKDEKTITGLMLRVEGEVLVVADGEGKEIRIPTNNIETNRETMLSPMPANFGDVIPEADFMHLTAYLLEQKAKEVPKK